MRTIVPTVLLYFLFGVTEGFLNGIAIFPGAICKKNACKTSKDCKGILNLCVKFSFCRKNKVCIAKSKITTTPEVTTTPTTPATSPTTKPKPTNSCPYPHENDFAKVWCARGHKKDAICRVSCKSDQCALGNSIIRCKCKDGQCKWTPNLESFCKTKIKDTCKNNGGCKPGYRCVRRGCLKMCKKVCTDSCKSSADCSSGKICRRTACGKKCMPTPPPCPRQCILGSDKSCPTGYSCEIAKRPCKSHCVKKSDPPKCPVFHPLTKEPKNVKEFCSTKPLSCKFDTDCGAHAVCCYSSLCKRTMCNKKENKCPLKMTERCSTDKDCKNRHHICVYNFGGCKTCSKGFRCSPKSCIADTDCASSQICRAAANGCLSCQIALTRPPPQCPASQCRSNADCINGLKCLPDGNGCKRCQGSISPQPPCIWHHCNGDNDCSLRQKCLPDALGCRQCQLDFGMGGLVTCEEGQKCVSNSQCKSGKCEARGFNCKVCIPVSPTPACDQQKRCIKDKFCKKGEKCVTQHVGCNTCVSKS